MRQNELRDGYIRLVITRGVGNLGLSPDRCKKATVIIIAASIALYPEEIYQRGLDIITCGTRRVSPAALSPEIKSLNYLNNILAKIEANQAGAGEGLMLNEQGYVAECTGDNIFVLKRACSAPRRSPPGRCAGITRDVVFEIARSSASRSRSRRLTRYDIFTADECFLTGTAAEIIPVISLDQRADQRRQARAGDRRDSSRFRELTQSSGDTDLLVANEHRVAPTEGPHVHTREYATMICDVCKTNESTVFLTQIVEGKMQKVNLCETCSKEKGVARPHGLCPGRSAARPGRGAGDRAAAGGVAQRCPACGFSQADFKKTGRLGCAQCYETFGEGLDLAAEGHAQGHRPRREVPARISRILEQENAMKTLQRDLQQAVANENYESAAQLRDQIRQLETAERAYEDRHHFRPSRAIGCGATGRIIRS